MLGFKRKKQKRSDCYDLMQKTMSFNNVTIVFLKELIIEYILVIWVKMKPNKFR